MSTLNLDLVREYVEKVKAKRRLDSEIKALNAEVTALEARVLEMYALSGVEGGITVDGMTVAPRHELWARPKDDDPDRRKLAHALVEYGPGCGMDDLVQETVNLQSLSARVREMVREGREIPKEILEHLKIDEGYRLQAQSSTRAKR